MDPGAISVASLLRQRIYKIKSEPRVRKRCYKSTASQLDTEHATDLIKGRESKSRHEVGPTRAFQERKVVRMPTLQEVGSRGPGIENGGGAVQQNGGSPWGNP